MKGTKMIWLIAAFAIALSKANKLNVNTQKQLNSFLIKTNYSKENIEELIHKAETSLTKNHNATVLLKGAPIGALEKQRPIRRRDLLRIRNEKGEIDLDLEDESVPMDEFVQVTEKEEEALEKAIEDDSFGYGYALLVIIVVLTLAIGGYQLFNNVKNSKEAALDKDNTDYILIDAREKDTEMMTLL